MYKIVQLSILFMFLFQTVKGQLNTSINSIVWSTMEYPLKFEKSKYNFKSGDFSGDLSTFVGCFDDDFNYCNDHQTLLLFDEKNSIVLTDDSGTMDTRIKTVNYNFEKQQIEIKEKSVWHEQIQRFVVSSNVYVEREEIYWFINNDLKDLKEYRNGLENYVNQVVKTATDSKIKVKFCMNSNTSTIDSIESNHPFIHFQLEKDTVNLDKYWVYMAYSFKTLIPDGEWSRSFFNSKESPISMETIQWNKGELTGLNERKMINNNQISKFGGYYLDGKKTERWKEIKYDFAVGGSLAIYSFNYFNSLDGKLNCMEVLDSAFLENLFEIKYNYDWDTLTNNNLLNSFYRIDYNKNGEVKSRKMWNHCRTICYKKHTIEPTYYINKSKDMEIDCRSCGDAITPKVLERIYPYWDVDFMFLREYISFGKKGEYYMIREFN